MLGQLGRIQLVRDQLVTSGNVDAHVARMLERRTCDSDVNFQSARIAQQLDDRADRVAPNDRVVDQNYTFALDVAREGAEFLGHS